jgi:hypothetical protein
MTSQAGVILPLKAGTACGRKANPFTVLDGQSYRQEQPQIVS